MDMDNNFRMLIYRCLYSTVAACPLMGPARGAGGQAGSCLLTGKGVGLRLHQFRMVSVRLLAHILPKSIED